MNLSNIKTEQQFSAVADIWYQRAHQLRVIWQNTKESQSRKEKAFALWFYYSKKIMSLVHFYGQYKITRLSKNMHTGGYVAQPET